MKKIEILSPAGDSESLALAVSNGADAVYLGLNSFNARIRAKNFTVESLEESIKLCHAHGVRVYVTLNIQLYNRELEQMLSLVGELYRMGADALIVADFGVASTIRKYYPDLEIHASTQASVHNRNGARELHNSLGFSRIVLARELDRESIRYISQDEEYETEIFVHGAHCMSVSGQCLLSYCLGGRSGNRGECAQPCRLPYKIGDKLSYPLSLKDMTLSCHIPELLDSGASSLKIEGRMKRGEYVGGVTRIWRELIDQKRNATKKELSTLEALFSRSGFTDGYFTGNISSSMLGTRSESDKQRSEEIHNEAQPIRRVKVDLHMSLVKGERARLTLTVRGREYTVLGDVVEEAISAPMSESDVIKNLVKLGNTPYEAGNVTVEMSEGIIIKNSSINKLRREAVEKSLSLGRETVVAVYEREELSLPPAPVRTALFMRESQIPKSYSYFDVRIVPAERYTGDERVNGVMLPPVILDREWQELLPMLNKAREKGVRYALITNIGQIKTARELGFELIADMRMNVFNTPCVNYLRSLGVNRVIMSPELSLAQLRDFRGYGAVVYGRLPMLTSHKCILKDTVGCERCKGYVRDRQGASFYAEGIFGHRCVMYNSVPIYMADKKDDIKSYSQHFIFTSEDREECERIIDAYKHSKATDKGMRRIKG
ncbi:MAG: U32 family peptidase [Clostridia bacterium]|nr:U32 family peptidase [Clostridia bacterium]